MDFLAALHPLDEVVLVLAGGLLTVFGVKK